MTTSRLALVVANVLGIVAGISGGYLMRRSKATTHVGRLYRVGDMTFVDGAFVDYLRAHLESYVDHEWTVFRLKDRGLFLRKEYDEGMLPGQKGPQDHQYGIAGWRKR